MNEYFFREVGSAQDLMDFLATYRDSPGAHDALPAWLQRWRWQDEVEIIESLAANARMNRALRVLWYRALPTLPERGPMALAVLGLSRRMRGLSAPHPNELIALAETFELPRDEANRNAATREKWRGRLRRLASGRSRHPLAPASVLAVADRLAKRSDATELLALNVPIADFFEYSLREFQGYRSMHRMRIEHCESRNGIRTVSEKRVVLLRDEHALWAKRSRNGLIDARAVA